MRQVFLLAATSLLPLASPAQTAPALPADQARVECRYRLTYQRDSTDAKTRTEFMRLQLGSKLSRCETENALFLDSTMTTTMAGITLAQQRGETPSFKIDNPDRSRFSTFFRGAIFKVPTTQQVLLYDRIGPTTYYYQEPASLFAWVITPTTATVAGYACQRATTSFGRRTWEAWFTRTVPIPDGPYKFYGLPGLIVKVGDTRGHYVFELTRLRPLAPPVAIAPPKAGARPLPKADFVRSKTEYDRNALAQMMASGNIRFNTPEDAEKARLKAQERARRKTNPLELR
jgi:GLPGLI family protein